MSYHARDPVWGLGFSETRLAPDVWRVMCRGYYIPEAQAGDYAMLRAAEVVKAAGYWYFVVENERSSAAVMGSVYGYVYGGSGSAFAAAYSYPETGLLVRGFPRSWPTADRWFSMRHSSAPKSSANTRSRGNALELIRKRRSQKGEAKDFFLVPEPRVAARLGLTRVMCAKLRRDHLKPQVDYVIEHRRVMITESGYVALRSLLGCLESPNEEKARLSQPVLEPEPIPLVITSLRPPKNCHVIEAVRKDNQR